MKIDKRNFLYYAVPAAAVALDQISKSAMRAHFSAPDAADITVIPGFMNLIMSHNTGGAFGILGGAPALFLAASLLFTAAAAWFLVAPGFSPAARWGVGFAAGGALGNLIDRVRFGSVFDFIDWYAGTYHWATFNVADAFIVAGAALTALALLKSNSPPVAK